jgi:hypothetical protein
MIIKGVKLLLSSASLMTRRQSPNKEEWFMSNNRKRSKQILIRLTSEEHDLLLQRMADADMQNQEAFLRQMTLMGYRWSMS